MAESRTRSEKANARLDRLADVVLPPRPSKDASAARGQADLAGRYVLLPGAVESARTPAELTEVEGELAELEEAAR